MAENAENKTAINVSDETIPVTAVAIQSFIYVIRGKQVMIDSDLAMLYGVETGALNRAVKRNIKRFPDEFRFQLTANEYDNLKCQIGISSSEGNGNGYGGRRTLPYAFTEQGIAMLSAVLRSETAILVSIRIMKTFVEMRKYLANSALLLEKVNSLETRQIESNIRQADFEARTGQRFDEVFEYISSHEEEKQKIFFDGQIFDAFSLLTTLIGKAEQSIVLIDGYVDVGTLNILSKRKDGVNITIYTLPSARITSRDIANFNAQYPMLDIKHTTAFHDRFLILDQTEGYHMGASIKDAGKKCFGINHIEDIGVLNDILQRAELTS